MDIGPAFLKRIAEQARKLRHEQTIKSAPNLQDTTTFPAGSIDVAFLCDTCRHFDHPEKVPASIHQALRLGARLAVIDFNLYLPTQNRLKIRSKMSSV